MFLRLKACRVNAQAVGAWAEIRKDEKPAQGILGRALHTYELHLVLARTHGLIRYILDHLPNERRRLRDCFRHITAISA